ncbi:MAG TPA: ABC transporter substrate-binding protein [Trebonia sp.]|jgi:NitT/TauT family transport system substrate-binding protein|nr:ABC transporter substrate-binding protein [Trebonia sp.]
MRSPCMRRLGLLLATGLLAAGLGACSSGSAASTAADSPGSGPELKNITIAILPITDAVVVQIAQEEGIFKQEGFDSVKVLDLKTLATSNLQLQSHTADIVAENYVSMFTQQAHVPGLNLRIIADMAQSAPNLFDIMVGKGSTLTSLSQLKGKKVGCPALGVSFCQLGLDMLLKPYGLSISNLTIVPVPFAQGPTALAAHTVDAVFEAEPFITIMEGKGARILQDLMSGPLAGAPQSCWGVQESFLQKYPKTVAAFARAMSKADAIADSDPALVRKDLPKIIPTLSPKLASVIGLPTWNTTLSLARMERVADIMEEFGALPKNFDVKQMYVPPPAGS